MPNQLWMLSSKMERLTGVKVELYVRVFLLFGRIVVGPAFHSVEYYQQRHSDVLPNTCNLHLYIAQFNAGARMLGDEKH